MTSPFTVASGVLPHELKVLPLLYLNEYSDYHNYIEAINLDLKQTDYLFLIKNRFPEFCKNVQNYGANYIYSGLVYLKCNDMKQNFKLFARQVHKNLEEIYYDIIDSRFEHHQIYGDIQVPLYELYKYLILEHSFKIESIFEPIMRVDDVDTFLKVEQRLDYDDVEEKLSWCYRYNSIKIFGVIMNNDNIDENLIISIFMDESRYHKVKDDIIRLIIQNYQLTADQLINILVRYRSGDIKMIDDLIQRIPKDVDVDLLMSNLKNVSHQIDWYIFKRIWREYSSKFTDQYIVDLYYLFKVPEVNVFLAHQPIVEETILGDDVELLFQK